MSSVGFRDCAPVGTPLSPRVSEVPGGETNCVNLDFTTALEFVPGSLEVYLDGVRLLPNGVEYSEGGDNQSFSLVLNPGSTTLLRRAPDQGEKLLVSYNQA